MDIDEQKSHKWFGSIEKKWEWYKHTKPCNSIINTGACLNTNCNYAHTVEEYKAAIQKRKFTLDFNVINQLYLASVPMHVESNTSNSSTRKRSRDESVHFDTKKARAF